MAQVLDGLTVAAGLFVAVSVWIVGFSDTTVLLVNNLVIGLAVAVLGVAFATAYRRSHRLLWLCPLLGLWTVIAPWVMSGAAATTEVVLTHVIGGAVIVVLGIADFVPMSLAKRPTAR